MEEKETDKDPAAQNNDRKWRERGGEGKADDRAVQKALPARLPR